MEPRKAFLASPFSSLLVFFLIITSLCGGKASSHEEHRVKEGPVVEKDQRRTLLDTEYGEISATDVKEGHKTSPYHLQFFTLEPNSVFLPVLLHAAMVFYVHTGSGKLTWANEDGTSTIDLREGDVCSLGEGSVFYIHSNLEAERKKLRINAMFTNTDDSTYDPSIGAYSRINKLVKGFDKKIVQAAFKVPEDLVEAITNKSNTPAIVHAASEKKHNTAWELEASFLKYFIGIQSNSKKVKTYNIFKNDPDFKNPHGWTSTVTKKQLKQLKRHNIGFLMVNLTMGSMLGPHWNPRATEVAVVLQGEGMVRVVCGSNNDDKTECKNMRFRVKQGDVFVVPRFHPMAHMSFDKEPLVFMGFSTAAKENHPQFLAGKGSVLQILDKEIVATSFGVGEKTIDKLLASRDDSIIFECGSCAEEEEEKMKEEREEEKEEEKKSKGKEEEEEEKKKEEEEAKKREEEEEEKERRRRKEEEEEVRRSEEERKREEEEARRQQEERERRREEEEARRKEEARREQEEVRREREWKREEEAQREQQKARRQQEKREKKREEEARKEREREREEEEEKEARREREGEAEREEAAAGEKKQRKEEAEREEEAARKQQEKRERRREEEEARREREEKEARREREMEKEKERRREEEAARRKQERREEAARRQQEKREKRREEEEERRREGEAERGREEEAAEGEEEAARRQQEEREKKREEEEERGREEEQTERERGGRRRRRQKGREEGRSREESAAEWEEEEARRQQEKRERRRERDSDNNKSMEKEAEGKSKGSSFEGRRVLKMRSV